MMINGPLNQTSHNSPIVPLPDAVPDSVDMAFGGKYLCRRRQLHLVRAACHHAITRLYTALEADHCSVARCNFNESARETLAAALYEAVRPSSLHQNRFPW